MPAATRRASEDKDTEKEVLRIFWRYTRARKKARTDEKAIQKALLQMMKELAVAAERRKT